MKRRHLVGGLVAVALATFALAALYPSWRETAITTLQRQTAKISPPRLLVIGDSLGKGTCWACRLKQNPLAVVNLAEGGATVRQVLFQVAESREFDPANVLIVAGLNDMVLTDRTLEQFRNDYRLLLAQAPPRSRLVVTLIPYTGFGSQSARITEANKVIAELARVRGATVIDLNNRLARDGVRRAEYTTDGVHFTDAAYRIWAADVTAALRP